MSHVNRWKFSGLVGALIILTAGLTLALPPNWAQPEPPLAELVLRPHELPEDSVWKESSPTTADDLSQPLNHNIFGPSTKVLTYREAYKVGAVIWDSQYSAYVGNYLYRYADKAQAEAAANEIMELFLREGKDKLLSDGSQVVSRGVHGKTVVFVGSEGDAIYWFIGVKGRTLILLMVNGMPVPSTQKAFESLTTRMLKR